MPLLGSIVLAVDREFAIVAALGALIVAALTVSVGAWVLLARERRLERTGEARPDHAPEGEPDLEPG